MLIVGMSDLAGRMAREAWDIEPVIVDQAYLPVRVNEDIAMLKVPVRAVRSRQSRDDAAPLGRKLWSTRASLRCRSTYPWSCTPSTHSIRTMG